MSGESTKGFVEVSGEKFTAKLGEVSLHGDTRDCTRPHSFEKKESRWTRPKSS